MANLEGIIGNTGKGLLSGIATVIDPVGAIATSVDYWISGAGPASERSLNTIYSDLYSAIYPKPNEDVDFKRGYVPRFLGNLGGAVLGAFGLYALSQSGYTAIAIGIPLVTGLYGTISTVWQYLYNTIKGEKIGGKYEKAKVSVGFKLGYHEFTHLPVMLGLLGVERDLTGRGLGESHVENSISENSNTMRRNFGSLAGYVGGAVAGAVVTALTLGIVPAYKTIRDFFKNFKGKKK